MTIMKINKSNSILDKLFSFYLPSNLSLFYARILNNAIIKIRSLYVVPFENLL